MVAEDLGLVNAIQQGNTAEADDPSGKVHFCGELAFPLTRN